MTTEREERLREALVEARSVLVVACGERAPYIKVVLKHIDAALAADPRQETAQRLEEHRIVCSFCCLKDESKHCTHGAAMERELKETQGR